ncbi:helix-turn-helix transcriptional regulator [Lichenihabitans sp. Uapishka_5]|uniref:helix-turn-helix transcriptional regulator n=1 Tax=Lichenihabitans sp. Uapishka_5 TaxID=3037302 RepID=UPI0029E80839|nr:helix-turn-helix transcriptional regulator [Lichenihabitans sp. Uapishka_5]MDX7950190.1 helix-turn-helix transcriptional regulator [Lichenihabitans sp. Uapishka_5]
MTKTHTAVVFRRRLEEVLARSPRSASAFAQQAGIDRSTLAQLLTADEPRLPRAETLVAVARQARVSVDWLLGLSQREETGAEIIGALLQVEEPGQGPVDDHFMAWLKEAEGFRVRTVPVALPDFLKTEALLRFEYRRTFEGASAVQLAAVQARLDFMCNPDSNVEVGLALQSLQMLARGEERWAGFPAGARREQIAHMSRIYAASYPSLRLYLYDLREVYSVPFTVFGAKRAVVFLGPSYFVMNGADHIRMFARRFDDLIRHAVVQPHEVGRTLEALTGLVS